eukprot:228273_1
MLFVLILMYLKNDFELNKLKNQYTTQEQIINDIKLEQIENKIEEKFKELFETLTLQYQAVLNELNLIKAERINILDTIPSYMENVRSLKTFLKQETDQYNTLLLTNNDREDRKNKILNIGHNVNKKYNRNT